MKSIRVTAPIVQLIDETFVEVNGTSTIYLSKGEQNVTVINIGTGTVTICPRVGDDLVGYIRQVETATCAGTVSTSGNAAVVVTGAYITGSPITLSVPVLENDTATVVATKIRNVLWRNSYITEEYDVGGSGVYIVLTAKNYKANDSTLNVSIDNDTSAGITQAASSANTVTGTSITLPTQNEYVSLIKTIDGWAVVDSGGVNKTETLANKTLTAPVLTNPATTVTLGAHNYGGAHADWTLSAAELLLPVHKPTNADSGVNAIVATTIRPYTFINATGQALTVKTAAGTGISIANGKTAMVMSDGTNVIRLTPDA